jgi:hypothetical protein
MDKIYIIVQYNGNDNFDIRYVLNKMPTREELNQIFNVKEKDDPDWFCNYELREYAITNISNIAENQREEFYDWRDCDSGTYEEEKSILRIDLENR